MKKFKRVPLDLVAVSKIDAIYASLPKIACKKLCSEFCCTVPATQLEKDRILNRLGRFMAPVDEKTLACQLLSREGLCKVYDLRPAICRLWSLVDVPLMRCPHGCVPERWMTDEEGQAFLDKVYQIGGPLVAHEIAANIMEALKR